MDVAKLLIDSGKGYLPGQRYYKQLITIYAIIIAILGVTLILCGEYAMRYALLTGPLDIVNLLIAVLYFALAIIPPCLMLYFLALIVLGLGQIVKNTQPAEEEAAAEKKPASVQTPSKPFTTPSKPVSTPSSRFVNTSATGSTNTWTCKNCGTLNSANYSQCKRCGEYKK